MDGLTAHVVNSPRRALALLGTALARRRTRAHSLNAVSSRSHCLVTLAVEASELIDGVGSGIIRHGRLVLADLAGSERIRDAQHQRSSISSVAGSMAAAARETGAINRSLFTLGQVLAALSVRGVPGITAHVPYRDSRLTQLLWEGLRGRGRTLMLACLSPLLAHASESHSTLHFACVARRITARPVINMDPQAR